MVDGKVRCTPWVQGAEFVVTVSWLMDDVFLVVIICPNDDGDNY